jgi:NADH-quinone oxidoreductase subunit N
MRDYTMFIPEYIAAGSAVLIISAELVWPNLRKDLLAYLTAVAAIAWAIASCAYIGMEPRSFQGLVQVDDFTTYFRLLAAGIVFCVALMSATYMREKTKTAAEYYGLLLVAGCGMVFMAAARELITAYISLELLTFCLYILVGYLKKDVLSSEASLKFILLGAFSSAIFLYGMSLIYGVTGTTTYDGISAALAQRGGSTDAAVIVGFMLIITGVGFKVSAAPFHMWAPDAYEGAPMPITAFLSSASEAAGFALILRMFTAAFNVDAIEWRWAFALIAAITMTLGNLLAIHQNNIKRLIAYSSIGQVGYMLVVIAAIGYGDAGAGAAASAALLLHLTGYIISTLALFTALTAYHNRTGNDTVTGLRGLAETQPFLALVIMVSLFSFAGLPFFAGFATKMFLFQAATSNELIWLVALGVINSFISLYYYLMIVRQMYLFDPIRGMKRFRVNPLMWGLGAALMIGVFFIGIYPGPVFKGATKAATPLFQIGADATNSNAAANIEVTH